MSGTREHGLHIYFYDEIVKSKVNIKKPVLDINGKDEAIELFVGTMQRTNKPGFMDFAYTLEKLFIEVLNMTEGWNPSRIKDIHIVFGMESIDHQSGVNGWYHIRAAVVGEVEYKVYSEVKLVTETLGTDLRFTNVPFNIDDKRMWVLYNPSIP